MADIRLAKPAAGTTQTVSSAPDGRFIFDFPADAATLTRNGDDLVLSFEDGSSIRLQGFYTTYSKEEMPSFQVEGVEISGQDFFAALGEDLMPAAGPAAGSSASRGGRYNEYGGSDLLDGIDHLGRLDIGFGDGVEWADDQVGGWTHQNLDPEISGIIAMDGNDMTLVESGVETDGSQEIQGNVFTPGVPVVVGQVMASDPDGGRLSYSFADGSNRIVTEYGVITIDADTGVITYTLNNDDPDADSLALGETVRQDFTVRVEDGQGGKAEASFSVTIKGTNDQPEVTLDADSELGLIESGVGRTDDGQVVTAPGTEEENQAYDGSHADDKGTQQLEGKVTGADVDAGHKLWFGAVAGDKSQDGSWEGAQSPDADIFLGKDATDGDVESSEPVEGSFGHLVLNSDGTWTYTLKGEGEAVQGTASLDGETFDISSIDALPEGATITDTFTIYVKDEHGAWNLETVTITITGSNDAPSLTVGDPDGLLYESGVGRDTTTSDHRPFDKPGQPEENTPYDNDAAGTASVTGSINAADVDHGDILHFAVAGGTGVTTPEGLELTTGSQTSVTAQGHYGQLVVTETANGTASYTYTLHENSDDVPLTFPVTVNGTTYASPEELKQGLDWDFDGQPTLDNLPEGATVSESFTIFVQDDKGAWQQQEVSFTITGTNDQPEVTLDADSELGLIESGVGRTDDGQVVTAPGTEEENQAYDGSHADDKGTQQLEGKVTGADVDAGHKLWFGAVAGDKSQDGSWEGAQSPDADIFLGKDATDGDVESSEPVEGSFGHLVLNSDGTWTYTLKGEGEAVQGTASLDGETFDISSIDALPEGATITDTFTIYVKDEHGAWNLETVTITITGSNDAPSLTVGDPDGLLYESGVGRDTTTSDHRPFDKPGQPEENTPYDNDAAGTASVTGSINAADVDHGDILHFAVAGGTGVTTPEGLELTTGSQTSVTAQGHYGQLVVTETANGTASYTYTLHENSDDVPLTFPVTVNGTTYASPEELKQGLDWDFDGQPTLDNLPEGATVSESFTIFVQDDKGAWQEQEVSFTITGTNDQPVLSLGDPVLELTESSQHYGEEPDPQTATATGHASATDADAGHELRYSFGLASDGSPLLAMYLDAAGGEWQAMPSDHLPGDWFATMTIDPETGEYTFTINQAHDDVQALRPDAPWQGEVTVRVTDDKGAYDEEQVTVTIKGSNDLPTFSNTEIHLKEEGHYAGNQSTTPGTVGPDGHLGQMAHATTVEGRLQAADIEDGTDLSYSCGLQQGQSLHMTRADGTDGSRDIQVTSVTSGEPMTIITEVGTFTIYADGRYTFILAGQENSDGFLNSLADGERWELQIPVSVEDKNGGKDDGTLTICIEGSNDKPFLTGHESYDYAQGDRTPVTDNDWDISAAEQGVVDGGNKASEYSDIINGRFQADDYDNGASLTFSATLNGAEMSPGLAGAVVVEDDGSLDGYAGSMQVIEPVDADFADAVTGNEFQIPAGEYQVFDLNVGEFYLAADGRYYFDVDDANALVQGMNQGEEITLNFTLTVKDEHGAYAEQEFSITIKGTNDKPELTLPGHTADADGNFVISITDIPAFNGVPGVVKGTFGKEDADSNDSHTFHVVRSDTPVSDGDPDQFDSYDPVAMQGNQTVVEGKYGKLILNADGTYSYKLYGPSDTEHKDAYEAIKRLDDGASLPDPDSFHVAVQDKNGAFDIETITFPVTGKDNLPVVSSSTVYVKESGVYAADDPATTDRNPDSFNNETSETGGSGKISNSAQHRFEVSGALVIQDWEDDADRSDGEETYFNLGGLTFSVSGTGEDGGTPAAVSQSSRAGEPDSEHGTCQVYETNYGTLTMYADGHYTFELDADAVDYLAKGQELKLSIKVPGLDSAGHVAHGTITVVVQGSNDVPELRLENALYAGDRFGSGVPVTDGDTSDGISFTVVEKGSDGEGSDVYTGKVSGADADNNADLFYGVASGKHGTDEASSDDLDARHEAFMDNVAEGEYGKLIINADGTYRYELNEKANDLAEGEQESDTFTIYVKDEHGAWTAQEVTFTVQGSNDLALVDAGSHTISVNAGDLVYNTNTDLTDDARDPVYDNNVAAESGSMTVQWQENSPETQHFGFAVEGKILEPDSEGGNTYTLKGPDGTVYGTLTLTVSEDGTSASYTFELNDDWGDGLDPNAKVNVSDLLKGLEVIAYDDRHRGPDGELQYTGQKLNIYVTGNNNRPDLELGDAADRHIDLGETGAGTLCPSVSGRLEGSDPDPSHQGETSLRYGFETSGQVQADSEGYGILQLDPVTGKYTYTVTHPDKLIGLADGKTTTVTFKVKVTDPLKGTSEYKDLTFTLEGKGDDAVIVQPDAHVTEFGKEPGDHVDGKLDFYDGALTLNTEQADGFWGDAQNNGDVEWRLTSEGANEGTDEDGRTYTEYKGEYGTLKVYEDGSYTYKLHDGAQKLAEGQQVKDHFSVSASVTDGDGVQHTVDRDISMQITGTNDAPTLEPDHGTFEEGKNITVTKNDFDSSDGGMTKTGQANGDDVDTLDKSKLTYTLVDDNGNPVTVLQTEYGSVTIDPTTGKYTYILNNESKAVQRLEAGEMAKDHFTVRVTDPHGKSADKTIEVQINGADEAGGGTAPVRDDMEIDGGREDHIWEDGTHKPVSDDMVWDPVTGQEVPASDKEASVSGGVGPNPENPGLSQDSNRVEGAPGTVGGSQFGAATSLDGPQSQVVEGTYGYLTIDPATGDYVYTLYNDNKEVQALGEGDSLKEDFYLMWNGQLVMNPDSGDPCNITVTITGTKDAPVIQASDTSLSVQETAGSNGDYSSATGELTLVDVDAGDTAELTDAEGKAYQDGDVIETPKGKVTLHQNDNGSWSYSYQYTGGNLAEGETDSDGFSLYVKDDDGLMTKQDFTVTITGANDAPTVNSVPGLEPVEDGSSVFGALVGAGGLFTDDGPDGKLSFAVSAEEGGDKGMWAQGQYGRLFIDLSGPEPVYRYYLDNSSDAVQELGPDDIVQDTFWITASDGQGGETSTQITVNVSGADDVPQFSVGDTILIKEGQTNEEGGDISVTRPIETVIIDRDDKGTEEDPGYSFAFSNDGSDPQKVETAYGTFTINEDGSFTFTLDNDADAVKELKLGQIKDIEQTIYLKDASGQYHEQTIHVSITGTNSAPELEAMTGSVTEDGSTSINVAVHDPDADAGDVLRYGFAELTEAEIEKGWSLSPDGKTLTTQYGTAIIHADGTITYTANRDQHLGAGEQDQETFRVQASDKFGAVSDPGKVTVTITGSNDAPSLTEGTDGSLVISDPDTHDTHTLHMSGGLSLETEGDIVLESLPAEGKSFAVLDENGNVVGELHVVYDAATGSFSYEFTADADYSDSLGHGQSVSLDFSLQVSDGTANSNAIPGSVTIESTNLPPVIGEKGTPGEDTNVGTVAITDSNADSLTVFVRAGDEPIPIGADPVDIGGVRYSYDGTLHYEILPDLTAGMEPGATGTHEVTLVVDDGHGTVDQQVSLPLISTNTPPEAQEPEFGPFDLLAGTVAGSLKASDNSPEGVRLNFSLATGAEVAMAAFGIVTVHEDGTFSYTLDPDRRGEATEDSFTIRISDGHGGVTDKMITLDLTRFDSTENAGAGNDVLQADAEQSLLHGLAGQDTLVGHEGDDSLYGDGGDDVLYGGLGQDLLEGGEGHDLLFGDGDRNSLDALAGSLETEASADGMTAALEGLDADGLTEFADHLEKTLESPQDGDDRLVGGAGDDFLFAGGGDDFLDGGSGRDSLFAGSGNDIIVYDQQDYLVSGGSGIDFMVSDDTGLTLDGLLSNTSSDKPLVSGIEVLLKGEDALSLTSIKDLADRYGITLGVNEAGEEILQLDDRWTKQDDGSYDFNGGAEADGGLTLETSLTPVETGDPASEAVQQQVFTLEHSNG